MTSLGHYSRFLKGIGALLNPKYGAYGSTLEDVDFMWPMDASARSVSFGAIAGQTAAAIQRDIMNNDEWIGYQTEYRSLLGKSAANSDEIERIEAKLVTMMDDIEAGPKWPTSATELETDEWTGVLVNTLQTLIDRVPDLKNCRKGVTVDIEDGALELLQMVTDAMKNLGDGMDTIKSCMYGFVKDAAAHLDGELVTPLLQIATAALHTIAEGNQLGQLDASLK
jgi:hypothetical protein